MPVSTTPRCPNCYSRVELIECSSVTHADNDGDPVEDTCTRHFCTNRHCLNNWMAIEQEDLTTLPA